MVIALVSRSETHRAGRVVTASVIVALLAATIAGCAAPPATGSLASTAVIDLVFAWAVASGEAVISPEKDGEHTHVIADRTASV